MERRIVQNSADNTYTVQYREKNKCHIRSERYEDEKDFISFHLAGERMKSLKRKMDNKQEVVYCE